MRAGIKRGHIGGLGFGFSQFVMLGVSSLCLVCGVMPLHFEPTAARLWGCGV